MILDVKSCLVDYNHSPEENMTFYIEKENQHKFVQENDHKSGCRRECGYK